MKVTAIKTPKLVSGTISIFKVLDDSLKTLQEKTIIVITSKIVSICEGNVIPREKIDKESLVKNESQRYLPSKFSKYGFHYTVTNNTLIPMAGVDESNGNGFYILWPKDAQKTANEVRKYLSDKFGVQNIGVIITDSTCMPLRRGTSGISLAHSGFSAMNDYVGKLDLFDRPFKVTQSNIAGGLSAAAVLAMGEGAEQTPICIITDVPFVQFQNRNPSDEELNTVRVSLEDDLFAPFLTRAPWEQGKKR